MGGSILDAYSHGGPQGRRSCLKTPRRPVVRFRIDPGPRDRLALAFRRLDALHFWVHLLVGGEACAAEQLRPWLAGRTVLNAYGPTEARVCTTIFDCSSDQRRPPIGRPLPNTRTHVLDQRLEPVPIGIAGELFIGGAGLARG
jgi:non-ribosomal peptide synthetase component F